MRFNLINCIIYRILNANALKKYYVSKLCLPGMSKIAKLGEIWQLKAEVAKSVCQIIKCWGSCPSLDTFWPRGGTISTCIYSTCKIYFNIIYLSFNKKFHYLRFNLLNCIFDRRSNANAYNKRLYVLARDAQNNSVSRVLAAKSKISWVWALAWANFYWVGKKLNLYDFFINQFE